MQKVKLVQIRLLPTVKTSLTLSAQSAHLEMLKTERIIKIGIDGGKGFLKFCLGVIDRATKVSHLKSVS